jgi:hypothetical protein
MREKKNDETPIKKNDDSIFKIYHDKILTKKKNSSHDHESWFSLSSSWNLVSKRKKQVSR